MIAPLKSAARRRNLIWQLLKNDLIGRYRGAVLGFLWSLLNPLMMLAVYYFIFTYVFEAKWQHDLGHKGDYAFFILTGILIHAMQAEVLTRSPLLISSNPNFVKKVVFPLALLPLNVALSAFSNFIIAFSIVLGGALYVYGFSFIALLCLPVLFGSMLIMMLGLAFLLSSLGVYLRDLAQIMGQLATLLLFVSPVLYPLDALPEAFRPFVALNPITIPIEEARNIIIFKKPPEMLKLASYSACSLLVFLSGYVTFRRLRSGFADVV